MDSLWKFTVRDVSWRDDLVALQALRREVFIVEQHVPESLEWDEADVQSTQVLALSMQGHPIGTGRLLTDGHIGRMAVLQPWRRHGVGSAILQFLIARARDAGREAVHLNAQIHALGFYARHGFIAHGAELMDAGIPHRQMTLNC